MIIELSEKQAREIMWCLLASLETPLKLGLGDLMSERIELVHRFAPPATQTQEAASRASNPWCDPTHQQEMLHAVENMIRFLQTQPTQRERLAIYQDLLHLMRVSHTGNEEAHQQEKEQ